MNIKKYRNPYFVTSAQVASLRDENAQLKAALRAIEQHATLALLSSTPVKDLQVIAGFARIKLGKSH